MHAGWRMSVLIRAALAMTAAASLTACSVIEGMTGNKAEVCAETRDAFTGFGDQLKTLAPNDNAAWSKAAGDFATRLDALAAKADDKKLKASLTDLAGGWRAASPVITQSGDVSQFSALLRDQPGRLGTACA